MTWTPLDAGLALKQAEAACAGMYGPSLTRLADGWEAHATFTEGRRFHNTVRSQIHSTPDAALEELVVLVELERMVGLP